MSNNTSRVLVKIGNDYMSEKRPRITSQSISFFLFHLRFCLHWINLEASWIEKGICLLIIITHQLKLTIHCLCKWCTCVIHPRGSWRRTLGDFAVTRTRKIKFIKKQKQINLVFRGKMKFLRFYEFTQDIVSVSALAFLTLSFASDIFSVVINKHLLQNIPEP